MKSFALDLKHKLGLSLIMGLALFAFWQCSSAPKNLAKPDGVQEDSLKAIQTSIAKFSHQVELAVLAHDQVLIASLLDPDYRTHELLRLYAGNQDQFFNGVFCGKVIKSDQYYCLNLLDIFAIKTTGIEIQENFASIVYRVQSSERVIETKLKVTLQKGSIIGLIGSKGFTQIE